MNEISNRQPVTIHCSYMIMISPCVFVCVSQYLSGQFNNEELVSHKQFYIGTSVGMSSCASYVSCTQEYIYRWCHQLKKSHILKLLKISQYILFSLWDIFLTHSKFGLGFNLKDWGWKSTPFSGVFKIHDDIISDFTVWLWILIALYIHVEEFLQKV